MLGIQVGEIFWMGKKMVVGVLSAVCSLLISRPTSNLPAFLVKVKINSKGSLEEIGFMLIMGIYTRLDNIYGKLTELYAFLAIE